MEIKRQKRVILSPLGYRKICQLVDKRASEGCGYHRCEWCGKTIGIFHHHHIHFRSEGRLDTLENLILLCANCHEIYAHGHKKHLYQKMFIDCRMNQEPIRSWNRNHRAEAEKIYKKYRRNKDNEL